MEQEEEVTGVIAPENVQLNGASPEGLEEGEEELEEEPRVGEELTAEPPPQARPVVVLPQLTAAAGRAGGAVGAGLTRIGAGFEAPPAPPEDDLSDLFVGPDMSRDADVYIDDVVSISEEDVFGEGGADMSDILEVSDEDIMGDDDLVKETVPAPRPVTVRRSLLRRTPQAGVAGLQY